MLIRSKNEIPIKSPLVKYIGLSRINGDFMYEIKSETTDIAYLRLCKIQKLTGIKPKITSDELLISQYLYDHSSELEYVESVTQYIKYII
jgi:hypothetical protein